MKNKLVLYDDQHFSNGTAMENNLVNCLVCHYVSPAEDKQCHRCGGSLSSRDTNSVQVALSLLITAVVLYIPANTYPIMSTEAFGGTEYTTIIGGIVMFLEHKSYFIAAIIFVASIIVPLAKMFALGWLCYSAMRSKDIKPYELTRLYRATEFIGKWSMVDVFVVAILVALIQLGGLMSIKVGLAATAFSGVVILTMISAHKFDTRVLWDKLEKK